MKSPTSPTRPAVLQLVTQLEPAGAQTMAGWMNGVLSEEFDVRTVFFYDKSGSDLFPAPELLAAERPRTLQQAVAFVRALRGLGRAENAVVVAHTHYAIAGAVLVRGLRRTPIIAVHHWPVERYPFPARLLVLLARRRRWFSEEVFVSDSIKDVRHGLVIENPVPAPGRREGASEIPVDILIVARHAHEKAIDTAIRSLSLLPGRTLTLVGGGPLTAALQELAAAEGVEDRVRFVGRLANPEVRGLMRGASVLLLPSRWEAMPVALLEAVAEDSAIVVSDIPAHRFLTARGAALSFPVDDHAALADRLVQVLEPRIREHLQHGRDRVRDELGESRIAPHWASVVAEAAGRRHRPRVLVWRSELLAGSETFIRNQIDAFSRWEPRALGLLPTDSPLRREDSDVTIFPRTLVGRLRRKLFETTRRSRSVDRAVRQIAPDLLHAHFLWDAAIIAPTARRLGIPLVITAHGFDVTIEQSPGRAGRRQRAREADALRYASRVVAVSHFIAERAAARGADAASVVVQPIGIPLRGHRIDESAPPLDASPRRVVFIGRLVEKKGASDLLDALALLPDRVGAFDTVVIGSGPLEDALRVRAERLRVSVRFTGALSPQEIEEELQRATVFAAPSRTAANGDSEGFGMVFLEAALASVPVVSYRHGGVPEAVVDGVTGLLAEEGDVEGLAAHLETLLMDPVLAARLGAAGRRRTIEQFDVLALTRGLEGVLDDVLEERR